MRGITQADCSFCHGDSCAKSSAADGSKTCVWQPGRNTQQSPSLEACFDTDEVRSCLEDVECRDKLIMCQVKVECDDCMYDDMYDDARPGCREYAMCTRSVYDPYVLQSTSILHEMAGQLTSHMNAFCTLSCDCNNCVAGVMHVIPDANSILRIKNNVT